MDIEASRYFPKPGTQPSMATWPHGLQRPQGDSDGLDDCTARGNAAALQRILAVRRRRKRDDRFAALIDSRFEQLPRTSRRRRA
jgi:hypothetical protein